MKICVFRYIRFASKSCGFEGRHVLRDSRFFQKVIRKARLRLQAGLLFPAPCREHRKGRDISFSKRDIPPLHPPRENLHCKRAVRRGAALAESTACARRCRVCLCYTIWPTPIIRCRSADLVGVQTNIRLPRHSSMRRAKQCRIPQAVCRRANVTRASR